MWGANTGSQLLKHARAFRGHTGSVDSITFSPDGTRVVSASRDRTIRVWSAETGALIAGPFEGHTRAVNSVSFSPDGTRIASTSIDGTVRMWNPNRGLLHNNTSRERIHVGIGRVNTVAFSPDGNYLVSGSSKAKAIPLDHVLLDASENGRIMHYDYTIHVWDIQSRGITLLSGPFVGHTDDITSAAFSFDSARVVSGSADCTVRVWDVGSKALLIGPCGGNSNTVTAVSFSPSGTLIASGTQDGSIQVWNSYTGECLITTRELHTGGILSITFSKDNSTIFSRSWDSTTRVWDSRTGILLDDSPFKSRAMGGRAVAISPDGTKTVSGTELGVIWVWDTNLGDLLVDPIKAHDGGITSLAFSFDGAFFVSGSDDQTIRVWELPNSQLGRGQGVGRWELNSDGWMIDSASQLLRWLPLELCEFHPRQFTKLIINSRGSLRLHLNDLLFGKSWQQCYKPSSNRTA
ncbi:hypothetical protein RSAG8_06841, partial [Rhizoctonia solani AG-8 WAC10335]